MVRLASSCQSASRGPCTDLSNTDKGQSRQQYRSGKGLTIFNAPTSSEISSVGWIFLFTGLFAVLVLAISCTQQRRGTEKSGLSQAGAKNRSTR